MLRGIKFALAIVLFPLMIGSVQAQDSLTTFSIEPGTPTLSPLNFPETDDDAAEPSDFEIKEYLLLSNGIGERRAVVTLYNTANGQRILKSNQISAQFANGDTRHAIGLSQKFSAQEHLTLNITFGQHIYPILSISVYRIDQPN